MLQYTVIKHLQSRRYWFLNSYNENGFFSHNFLYLPSFAVKSAWIISVCFQRLCIVENCKTLHNRFIARIVSNIFIIQLWRKLTKIKPIERYSLKQPLSHSQRQKFTGTYCLKFGRYTERFKTTSALWRECKATFVLCGIQLATRKHALLLSAWKM